MYFTHYILKNLSQLKIIICLSLANIGKNDVIYIQVNNNNNKEGVIMTPYKSFINAAKAYFNSVPFLKFLLTASIFVFGIGGFFYLLGAFVLVAAPFISTIGIVLMYAGLLLTLIKEDIMTLVMTSGVIAVGSLAAFITSIVSFGGYGGFAAWIGRGWFEPFFYFLAFGAITALVFIKSEKFKQKIGRAHV